MDVDEAYKKMEAAIEAGRVANGYLVVGALDGSAKELTLRILKLLFGECNFDTHPDIHRMRPLSKARLITIGQLLESRRSEAEKKRIRGPGFLDKISMTSFLGGWKVGIVEGADCLNDTSRNAFLKTLEEPPPRTLFLLLSERPEQLLPTIISRCQRIDLPDARAQQLEEPYRTQVLDVLAGDDLTSVTARAAAAAKLAAVLEALEELAASRVQEDLEEESSSAGEEVDDDALKALVSSRYRESRADFVATVMSWFRDLMALCAAARRASLDGYDGGEVPLMNEPRRAVLERRARKITRAQAFRNVEAIESFATSLERNLPELPLLSFLIDRLAFGAEGGL